MINRKGKKFPRKKSELFKPTRIFINSAVEDYLNRGGNITKLVLNIGHNQMMQGHDLLGEADEFLS